jgi:hypothetical protein
MRTITEFIEFVRADSVHTKKNSILWRHEMKESRAVGEMVNNVIVKGFVGFERII